MFNKMIVSKGLKEQKPTLSHDEEEEILSKVHDEEEKSRLLATGSGEEEISEKLI